MSKIKNKALTYDDVLLIPKYSDISSRSHINLNTKVSRRYGLLTPYVASCMDTVCESEMAIKMAELGGVGCIHRFMTVEEQCEEVKKVRKHFQTYSLYELWGVMYDNWHSEIQDIPVMAAIGVMNSDIQRAIKLVESGANILIIDVAHGHHSNVKTMISELKKNLPDHVDIIAGNISTTESAMDLRDWGADGLRVGIGGGCFTPNMQIKTPNGLKEIKDVKIGDIVYTHTGKEQKVINKLEFIRDEEIMLINGIECTKNHEFYVVDEKYTDIIKNDDDIHKYAEWVPAEKLTKKHMLIEL